MRILGLETTCDETAAAVIDGDGALLSNVVFSQIDIHKKYNGVVPELASRAHAQRVGEVLEEAVACLGRERPSLDYVAFANGPGLPGALLVGKIAAEAAARLYGAKLVGVNHLEGHLAACELSGEKGVDPLPFPLVALVVSGGHTELWLCKGYGDCRVLGRTRDDAAGEAFDKVAKLLGLGYPGGPVVEKTAKLSTSSDIRFPRPAMKGTWEFSFSGLKTSVSYFMRDNPSARPEDICAEFQRAVVDTLAGKLMLAARKYGVKCVAVGGGVAANGPLRERIASEAARAGMTARFVERRFCTDNGAMIALAGLHKIRAGRLTDGPIRINPEMRVSRWGIAK